MVLYINRCSHTKITPENYEKSGKVKINHNRKEVVHVLTSGNRQFLQSPELQLLVSHFI